MIKSCHCEQIQEYENLLLEAADLLIKLENSIQECSELPELIRKTIRKYKQNINNTD